MDLSSFRAQMSALAASGTRVVPLADIEGAPGNAVAITFDDGFTNFADSALPVLEEHGFPVTLFVVTEKAGTTNDWEVPSASLRIPSLPLLDWDGVRAVAARGVEIGAHTRTHPDLSRVDAARLADEVAGSAEDIARETGRAPSSFAFPYGGVDSAAAKKVAGTYAISCTTEFRLMSEHLSGRLLPRIDAYYLRGNNVLASFGTHRFGRFVAARRFARAVRRSIG
jgi:peptidoglycan/xylan/chitin deacetylase (PgdA/CDA1 family)